LALSSAGDSDESDSEEDERIDRVEGTAVVGLGPDTLNADDCEIIIARAAVRMKLIFAMFDIKEVYF
jgi:hypothetical protein